MPAAGAYSQRHVDDDDRDWILALPCWGWATVLPAAFRLVRSRRLSGQTEFALGHRVETHGGDWWITWNRQSRDVRTARSGALLIADETNRGRRST